MEGRRLRKLMQRLADQDVFISYTVGFSGQRIRVWGPEGLPVSMQPGTAKVYADRLEAQEWGFGA